MDAFNGDATAAYFVAANIKADKIEAQLIAAKVHQEAAYNKYTATIESLVTRFGDKPWFFGVFFYGTGRRIAVFRK